MDVTGRLSHESTYQVCHPSKQKLYQEERRAYYSLVTTASFTTHFHYSVFPGKEASFTSFSSPKTSATAWSKESSIQIFSTSSWCTPVVCWCGHSFGLVSSLSPILLRPINCVVCYSVLKNISSIFILLLPISFLLTRCSSLTISSKLLGSIPWCCSRMAKKADMSSEHLWVPSISRCFTFF